MKIFVKAYGCTLNQGEAEIIRGILKERHELTDISEADAVIVSTCYVKGPSERKAIDFLKSVKEKYPNKKIIISGCGPEIDAESLRKEFPDASLVSTHHITEIAEAVNDILKGERVEKIGLKKDVKLLKPKVRKQKGIAIVPISSGCNNSCSYCCVRIAKGPLFSYPKEKIIQEIKNVLKEGCDKIWLTSQDNGSYNDNGINLAGLLKEIIRIEGNFKVRVGMMNPEHLEGMLEEMIEIYKNPKIIKFLHLPVQSGSNEVLRVMGRKYTVEEFENMVGRFREALDNIGERSEHKLIISTDIIVGFPSETEEQFKETVSLVERIKPEVLNISKFYARPGTRAKKMKQLASEIIKKRSVEVSRIFEEIRKL